MEAYQIALIAAAVFGILELLTLSFVFLSVALSLCVIAAFEFVTSSYNLNREILLLVIGLIVFNLLLRKLFTGKRLRLDSLLKKDGDDVNKY